MGKLSDAYLTEPDFDGRTFSPTRDASRLRGMMAAVYAIMSDHQWHTLRELADRCGRSETGVSARIRDLRKYKFGGYTIHTRCSENGLWEYRLAP